MAGGGYTCMNQSIQSFLEVFACSERNFYVEDPYDTIRSLMEKICIKNGAKEVAKKAKISQRMLYYYLRKERRLPLNALYAVIVAYGNRDAVSRTFLGQVSAKGNTHCVLPEVYSKELAHLCGVICGDGHIAERGYLQITNNSPEFLELVRGELKNIFKVEPRLRNVKEYHVLSVYSLPVCYFLSEVLGIPRGQKKGKLRIPSFINLSLSFKKCFLQGIFETDGGFTTSKGKVSVLISSSTPMFLKEVQELLRDFNIVLKGPYCSGGGKGGEIRSFKKEEVIKFKKRIGFRHPEKQRAYASVA